MHPEDAAEVRGVQEERVLQLYDACLANDRQLLLEVQPSPETTYDGESVAALIRRFYELGVHPEWWKIPPNPDPGVWTRIGDVVREHDLVLGRAAEEEELAESFAAAASEPMCRGFAIGRSIYGEPARRWLAGEIDDEELQYSVAERYGRMNELWQNRNEQSAWKGTAG
jgi:5-dehydro-2-deoxygluconokinase